MVWKIRSKTAFIYEHGVHRYVASKHKAVPYDLIEEIPFYDVKTDLYSSVKIIHNYRNISRAAKQFLLGDNVAEQMMLSFLRSEFLYPITKIKSPMYHYIPIVSNLYYIVILINILIQFISNYFIFYIYLLTIQQRVLSDHTDRHYSLVANNQHPIQLLLYENLNQKYREDKNKRDYKEGKGEITYYIALEEKVKQLKDEKLKHKDTANGEDITLDELSDIYRQAVDDVRSRLNMSVRTTGKNGYVEDYLESRRPFTNNEPRNLVQCV